MTRIPPRSTRTTHSFPTRRSSDLDALHLMGLSLHALGRRAEGLASIERAIALRPDEPIFLTNAGVVAMALGRAESAAHYYRRALALDPRYADAHNNLATLLESRGDRKSTRLNSRP